MKRALFAIALFFVVFTCSVACLVKINGSIDSSEGNVIASDIERDGSNYVRQFAANMESAYRTTAANCSKFADFKDFYDFVGPEVKSAREAAYHATVAKHFEAINGDGYSEASARETATALANGFARHK